jgi:hypothetical protein
MVITGSNNSLQVINQSTPQTNTPINVDNTDCIESNNPGGGSGGGGSGGGTDSTIYVTIGTTQTVISSKTFTLPVNIAPAILSTQAVTLGQLNTAVNGLAPLDSPAFINIPRAPTATLGNNSTQIATTAFVQATLGSTSAIYFNNQFIGDGLTSGTAIGVAFDTTPTLNSTKLITSGGVYTAITTIPTLTFNNGLVNTSGIVQLGGSLVQDTAIAAGSKNFSINALGASFHINSNGILITDSSGSSNYNLSIGSTLANLSCFTGTGSSNFNQVIFNTASSDIGYTSSGVFTGLRIDTGGYSYFNDDNNQQGFSYPADYSGNGVSTYGDRWIADLGYIKSIIPTYTFTNGLTNDSFGNITLGGSLAQNTIISTGIHSLNLSTSGGAISTDSFFGSSGFTVQSSNGTTSNSGLSYGRLVVNPTSTYIGGVYFAASGGGYSQYTRNIAFSTTGVVATCDEFLTSGSLTNTGKGITYAIDYSLNYVARSLIDKGYADAHYITVGGGTITTNALTINNSGAGATSPATFNGSTAITMSYNTIGAAPSTGSTNYIQNTTSQQATSNFNISGSGVAGSNFTVQKIAVNSPSFLINDAAGLELTRVTSDHNTNFFAGYQSGFSNIASGGSSGKNNVALGYQSLFSNTIGEEMIAIGSGSLFTNTTGLFNIALGYHALFANTSGSLNIAIGGLSPLVANTTGHDNLAIGTNALLANTSGANNIALLQSLQSNTIGTFNVALGGTTLQQNISGGFNMGIGSGALNQNTTGSYSVGIGTGAGASATTGSFNISIGSYSDMPNITRSGQLNIGNVLYGLNLYQTASNSSTPTVIGSIGIGLTTPTARLHLPAGTATASTAPLKLTSGTNLTIIEDGAVEYNGTHLYFSIGSTRYQLDQQAGGGGSGTVTSVSGVATNGFTWSIATATTTPAITLTLQNATTSQNGQLISTDWNTFNGKQTALSGTGFVKISGTTISYDNSSYVPYTGATGNVNLGTNFISAGAALTPLTALHAISTISTVPRGILSDQNTVDVVGARITMRKSRGTPGTPTVITTADALGSWIAAGHDGTNYIDAGKVLVTSIGTIATGIVPATMALQTANASGTLTTGILIDQSQQLTFGGYSTTGIAHLSSSGVLTSSLIVNADITVGTIANASLVNSSITINGSSISLGGTSTITTAGSTLTGTSLNSTIVSSFLTSVGTIITGVWNGTAIANANLANSTISGISLGGTLGALTATNTTLTFSGSYTGVAAQTIGLNLSNANTWAALQTFGSNISIGGVTSTGATGTGNNVFSISPSFTTPTLGVATATTINGNTFTTGTYTLTGVTAKTLTFNNSITIAGTDATTMTFPTTSATIARTDAAQTFTGIQTFIGGLNTSGNVTAAAWGLSGLNLQTIAATYTDNSTAAGVTVTNAMVNTFGQPTIIAANATSGSKVTYTNAATVYIAGIPILGANTLATNLWALSVTGNAFFSSAITATQFNGTVNGALETSSTLATSGFGATNSTSTTTTSGSALFAGASTVNFRVISNGSAAASPATTTSYSTMIIGGSSVNIPSTGTSGLFASMVINPLVVNTGAGTLTESATLYINGAATNATANYALHSIGNNLFTGNVTLGTAGNRLFITEGSNAPVGQVALVSGTKAITITGITTSSRVFVQLVTPSGSASTIETQAVCTSNTLTIQANIAAGTINTSDNSTYNYFIVN